MELEQPRPAIPAMTFDEVSMERSKNFVKALQELKNLRPQLYSAAEYCEKSYLHSEQKQMVLDNLKDYAVRALVNAVDHLGTVAYKLTDLLDQQTLDISTTGLKVSCINQKLLTCQTYTEKEGLRQQQMLAFTPRHHKHYVLPNSVNKKVHFGPRVPTDTRQSNLQARNSLQPSNSPASKTLSWHLASETKSTLKGTTSQSPTPNAEDTKNSGKNIEVFRLLENGDGFPTNGAILGATRKGGSLEGSKPMTAFRSFDTQNQRAIVRVPVRSKSVLSSFFVKQKASKLKAGSVS